MRLTLIPPIGITIGWSTIPKAVVITDAGIVTDNNAEGDATLARKKLTKVAAASYRDSLIEVTRTSSTLHIQIQVTLGHVTNQRASLGVDEVHVIWLVGQPYQTFPNPPQRPGNFCT